MIKKLAMTAFLLCSSLSIASWTIPEVRINDSNSIIDTPYTDHRFLYDAYQYRLKNKLPIPDYYYDTLKIENPNTPIWAKIPAQEYVVPQRVSPIPEWILVGILMRETKSYYDKNGNIVYIDKTNGTSGEKGPFQITPVAFEQIKKKGETHSKVKKNMVYAQEMTERYLLWLYNGPAKKNWDTAIRMYNAGPSKWRLSVTLEYLKDVKRVGTKK